MSGIPQFSNIHDIVDYDRWVQSLDYVAWADATQSCGGGGGGDGEQGAAVPEAVIGHSKWSLPGSCAAQSPRPDARGQRGARRLLTHGACAGAASAPFLEAPEPAARARALTAALPAPPLSAIDLIESLGWDGPAGNHMTKAPYQPPGRLPARPRPQPQAPPPPQTSPLSPAPTNGHRPLL
ncbi:WAS/WASL-interacting protein family member 3-like [Schistocerca gregaria]|uniref:WAS/WASL-interacting protein family member 3-like n=1 Tax=Schistocerca gregaria TaxID=7010 RepID=UPI00211E574B|nr:WAS/WASL-interacting protein family member 3-like [Schistocerca gregaria]